MNTKYQGGNLEFQKVDKALRPSGYHQDSDVLDAL